MALPWYVQQALDQRAKQRAAEAKARAPKLTTPGGRAIFGTILRQPRVSARVPRAVGPRLIESALAPRVPEPPPIVPLPQPPGRASARRPRAASPEALAAQRPALLERAARGVGGAATQLLGTAVGRTAGLVGAIQAGLPIGEIPGAVVEAGREGARQLSQAAATTPGLTVRRLTPEELADDPIMRFFAGAGSTGQLSPGAQTARGRVPLGTQISSGGEVYQAVTFDARGNPIYRRVGSPGPRPFEEEMVGLAVQSLQGATETERGAALERFQERLRFVNLGFGGAQAQFDAAVTNAALSLAKGNFPDFMTDAIGRELPWRELGYSSYQEYLQALGYEDLGNGVWRKLAAATRAGLGIPNFAGAGGRGAAGSQAPGGARFGSRPFIGLVNWRV